MRSSLKVSSLLAISAALSLTACNGAPEDSAQGDTATAEAPAAEEPAIIAERQENFEEMGDAFKPIADTLKTDAPDLDLIAANAAIISANLKNVPDHFPADTGIDDGYDTEALATIWEKPEEFATAAKDAIAAGEAFLAAANSRDLDAIKAGVGELGNSCKTCHDTFRADDE
jgi:cytochrome c556